jgi:hypothetical protein
VPDKTSKPTVQPRQLAESHRDHVTVRVSVLDRHDEEETEAGYGHGV